ncbi:MAG: serine hydrolase [Chitinophagaceae bacterium]|nr:serine hydrolase [Chitinophagaceae bacterium]
MHRGVFVFVSVILFNYLFAQKADKKLQRKIEAAVKGFKGDYGVYIKKLEKNKVVAINADSLFPTASIIKIPILIGVADKIQKGELQYHQELTYKDSLLYEGVDILGSFKNNEKIELSKVMMLMITMSDNTASLWLQSLAGTGIRINQILDSLGLVSTRVNSRTPGRELNRSVYGWGQTTPREIATLLERIYKGEIISPEASERMQRLLKNVYWDSYALSQLPPYVNVYAKYGAVDEVRSEVVLVNAPHGDIVFAIMTKNNKDTSWNYENEGWQLARKLTQIIWQHYEPHSKWHPMKKDKNKWF